MTKIKTYITHENFNRILEAMVLAAVVLMTISYFGGYFLVISTIGKHSRLMDKIALALLFAKVLCTRYEKKEFFWIAGLGALALINYYMTTNTGMIYNTVFVCSLKNVDVKKMLKASLMGLCFIILLLAILSLAGIFGEVARTQVYRKGAGVETRYCFGFHHPNQWANAMFTALLLYVLAYWEKLNWWKLLLITLVNGMIFFYSDSKAGLLTGCVLILLTVMYRYGGKIMYLQVFRMLAVFGVFLAWAMPMLAMTDSSAGQWITQNFNEMLTGRLVFSKRVFDNFGLSVFGRYITGFLEERGYGLPIDLGGVKFLLENGVIIFAVLFVGVFFLLFRGLKNKNWPLVIAIACISLYSINETLPMARIPGNVILYYAGELLFTKIKAMEKQ